MYGSGMSGEARTAEARRDAWRRQAVEQAGTLLFETAGEDAAGQSYLFHDPVRILTANDEDSLQILLVELTTALDAGFFIAGLLRYEAGVRL